MIKLNDFGRENKMYKLVPIAYNTKTYDILLTGIDDDILYFCLIHNKKYTELFDTEDIFAWRKIASNEFNIFYDVWEIKIASRKSLLHDIEDMHFYISVSQYKHDLAKILADPLILDDDMFCANFINYYDKYISKHIDLSLVNIILKVNSKYESISNNYNYIFDYFDCTDDIDYVKSNTINTKVPTAFHINEWKNPEMFMYCETEQDKLEFCQYLKEQGKEWRDYDDLKDIYGNNTIYYFNQNSFDDITKVNHKSYHCLNWKDFKVKSNTTLHNSQRIILGSKGFQSFLGHDKDRKYMCLSLVNAGKTRYGYVIHDASRNLTEHSFIATFNQRLKVYDENILMHTFVAEEINLYKIDSTTFIIQCID